MLTLNMLTLLDQGPRVKHVIRILGQRKMNFLMKITFSHLGRTLRSTTLISGITNAWSIKPSST